MLSMKQTRDANGSPSSTIDNDITQSSRKGTILFVAAADRGHFSWCIALAYQLKNMGYNCELWTHKLAEKWVTTNELKCFDKIVTSLGDGIEFNSFVASYKWASSYGNYDNEGASNVCKNNCEGLNNASKKYGFKSLPTNFNIFFSNEGKKQLLQRILESKHHNKINKSPSSSIDVIACLWEKVWCDWMNSICNENDIPSIGIMPSFLHPFRASVAPIKFWWFDNEERVRNLLTDIDPPMVSTCENNKKEDNEMVYVLADCLRGDVEIPIGRKVYGPFFLPRPSIENMKERLSSNKDINRRNIDDGSGGGEECGLSIKDQSLLSLFQWLDVKDSKPVILISLGSQSCLASLGPKAALTLLRGCLLTSYRILAVGIDVMSQEEEEEDIKDIKEAVLHGNLRFEPWIDQWFILHHEAIQRGCFISHCGANSVHEALACKVKILPLPFFDDQYYIANRLLKLYYPHDDNTEEEDVRKNGGGFDEKIIPKCEIGVKRNKIEKEDQEVVAKESLSNDEYARQIYSLSKSLFCENLQEDKSYLSITSEKTINDASGGAINTDKTCCNETVIKDVELYICKAIQQTLNIPDSIPLHLQKSVLEEEGTIQVSQAIINKISKQKESK